MAADIIALNPRIEIIEFPLAGELIPEDFLWNLVGKIFPVDSYVYSHTDFWGHRIYEYRVAKEILYRVLLKHAKMAAAFLREHPDFFPDPFLRFEEKYCRLIGNLNILPECNQQTGCRCR